MPKAPKKPAPKKPAPKKPAPKKPAPKKPAPKKPAPKKPAQKKPAHKTPAPRHATPTAKAKPAKSPPPAKPPASLVDKALKARWEEAISRYRKSRTEELAGWDERYEALGEILDSDPPYYLAAGYKSAREFLQVEAPGQDERSVRTYVRVARWFDPADEAKHGITKLDRLLDYLEAAGGAPLAPAKIHLGRQKVRVVRDGKTQSLPFDDVTTEELRAAARAGRGSSGAQANNVPPAVKTLRAALSKARLGAVSVRLRGGKLILGDIALDRLADLGRTLSSVKLPQK